MAPAKKSVLPIILFALIGLTVGSWDQQKVLLQKKLDLLKTQDNEIDHGPDYKTNPNTAQENMSNKKKQILLGYPGEHWSVSNKGKSNYISSKDKKIQEHLKSMHNDDARLQDLDFEPKIQPKQQQKKKWMKKVKKSHQKKKGKKDSYNQMKKRREFLKKSMKKEIKKALKSGMSLEQIDLKFRKEKKFPRKMYKKILAKKFNKKKNYSQQP